MHVGGLANQSAVYVLEVDGLSQVGTPSDAKILLRNRVTGAHEKLAASPRGYFVRRYQFSSDSLRTLGRVRFGQLRPWPSGATHATRARCNHWAVSSS